MKTPFTGENMDYVLTDEMLKIFGAIFLIISLLALFFESSVLIAVYRLMKKNDQFILLFSQNVAEVLSTCQFVWLSVEIILQQTTGIPLKIESLILRFSIYPEALHYILIAMNRSQSILFPLGQHDWWSKKNLRICAVICWLLGWTFDVIITYGIPSDDDANFGHDISSMEFGRIDRTKYGADDLLRANLILYLSTIAICAMVYSIALISIFRGKCQSSKASMAWQTSDAKLKYRLFIICFTNFIPFSIMIYFTYVSPPRTFIGNLFKTLFNILNSTVNSGLLFIFSSLVRKHLPRPMSRCLPSFISKHTTAIKIEPI